MELHLSDELIINTTATINNISFFAKQKSTLMQKQQEFAKGNQQISFKLYFMYVYGLLFIFL